MTAHFPSPKPAFRACQAEDPPAFDLSAPKQYQLARQIYFGRFSGRVAAAGLDPDETFQDILEGLLRKARSERSRWNPRRGSLSTWIYVATSGLVINLVERERTRQRVQVGTTKDVALWPTTHPMGWR